MVTLTQAEQSILRFLMIFTLGLMLMQHPAAIAEDLNPTAEFYKRWPSFNPNAPSCSDLLEMDDVVEFYRDWQRGSAILERKASELARLEEYKAYEAAIAARDEFLDSDDYRNYSETCGGEAGLFVTDRGHCEQVVAEDSRQELLEQEALATYSDAANLSLLTDPAVASVLEIFLGDNVSVLGDDVESAIDLPTQRSLNLELFAAVHTEAMKGGEIGMRTGELVEIIEQVTVVAKETSAYRENCL